MSDEQIEFLRGELATIEFRPGDTAVLMFPAKLSHEQLRLIDHQWREIRPDIKCIILDAGARLGVIRSESEGRPELEHLRAKESVLPLPEGAQ